jgi:hypothetical protein
MLMGDLSKREVVTIIVGIVVAVTLMIWGTVAVLNHFVLNSDDPLAKAGGLKPEQIIEHK